MTLYRLPLLWTCRSCIPVMRVILTYDSATHMYTIAAPGLFRAMDTTNPRKVAYKLAEKKIRAGDAEAVEKIVCELLLPKLEQQSPKEDGGLPVC